MPPRFSFNLTLFSLRSVERIIKEHNLKTVRRPGLTQLEQTSAILTLAEEDPLSRWGARKYKEKLENRGVLVPRCVTVFLC